MTERAPLRHRLEYGAYRFARRLWSAMPEHVAVRMGAAAGWLCGSVLRIRRREVDEHLAVAFPDRPRSWRRRVARRSYAHLGREAAVLVRMPAWSRQEVAARVRFENLEELRAAADEGAVVVLTAHLGNWELGGAALAALGFPMDVVGKGMANRRFERDLFALRERLGMRVIEISDAPKGVLRSLGRGRVAALLGDQNAHRFGIYLPFFGRRAATSRGPALFALRTGAPVFVGFPIRDPGWAQTYTVQVRRLTFEPGETLEEQTFNLLTAYHRALEESIRAAPDQYFWQHKRWKTRPPEEHAPTSEESTAPTSEGRGSHGTEEQGSHG